MLGTYLQGDPNLDNYLYDDRLAKMRAASSSNVKLKPDGPSFLRRVYNRILMVRTKKRLFNNPPRSKGLIP